jgi:hypothetical protein
MAAYCAFFQLVLHHRQKQSPMAMKTRAIHIFFSIMLCVFTRCIAGEDSYTSEPTDDLRVAVASIARLTHPDQPVNRIARSSEMLLFGVRTVTNKDTIVSWPKKPEYQCTVELLDEAGKAMPRTKMGRLYGSKYSDFDPSKGGLVRQHIDPSSAPCWNLFRPADLFNISKPGTYTLRLQLQAIKVESSNTTNVVKIVRFPMLSLPIQVEEGRNH